MNNENWEDLQKFLPLLEDLNLDVSFLFITETAFKKSIIDATIPFRKFLKRNSLHDYQIQGKGNKEFGIKLDTQLILSDKIVNLKSSLYRPKTKKGDPRIWFNGLKNFYDTESFIAVTTDGEKLIIFNLSDKTIRNSLETRSKVYNNLYNLSKNKKSNARELFIKLKEINSKGFIKTAVEGDTGIGMTLEQELGIRPNAYQGPDYKGIELKTSRENIKKQKPRVNLYTKVPIWNEKFNGAKSLIDSFGYWSDEKNRMDLNCTLKSDIPNSQGLYLKVDEANDCLWAMHKDKGKIVKWDFKILRKHLMEKHHETFWIEAESKLIKGIEHFYYKKIIYTKNPNVDLIPILINEGIITVDFIMHIKSNGKVRHHGFPIKINDKNLGLLFPEPKEYNLETDSIDDF